MVAPEEPAERSVERADADPEADHPAHARQDRDLVAEGSLVAPEDVARDQPEEVREDDAADDGRGKVLVTSESATLGYGGRRPCVQSVVTMFLLRPLRLRREPARELLRGDDVIRRHP